MIRSADDYSYAYLLGMYLGDGHLADTGRTFQLRITLDGRYPAIIEECAAAMILSLPSVRPVVRTDRPRAVAALDRRPPHLAVRAWADPL